MIIPTVTPRQAAYISITGFITVVSVGIVSCVLLLIGLLWFLLHAVLFLLASTINILQTIATTYQSASPDVRLFVLVIVAIGLYHACRKVARKGRQL